MQAQEGSWRRALQDLGLDLDTEYRPSQLSGHTRKGASALADHRVRQEATLTSKGLVVVLMSWCVFRRRVDERERATTILTQNAANMSGDGFAEFGFSDFFEGVSTDCAQDEQDGMCTHLRRMVRIVEAWQASCERSTATTIRCTVSTHDAILKNGAVCEATKALRVRFVLFLAQVFGDAASRFTDIEPLNIEVADVGPGRKRARLDEDFKRVVGSRVIQAGKARSAAAWGRATGKLPLGTAVSWEVTDMKAYPMAGHKLGAGKIGPFPGHRGHIPPRRPGGGHDGVPQLGRQCQSRSASPSAGALGGAGPLAKYDRRGEFRFAQ